MQSTKKMVNLLLGLALTVGFNSVSCEAATSASVTSDAQYITGGTINNQNQENKKPSLAQRIHALLYPETNAAQDSEQLESTNTGYRTPDTMILGGPVANQEQCVRYLLHNNPHPMINVSPQELVAYYYEEGTAEGVRPDIAFAQALKETGYFRYGGTVIPAQNNYCGLGTTSRTVQGAYFSSPRLGVRAHIQHLLAYSSTKQPTNEVVDPRYDLVRSSYGDTILPEWDDLNGRWAVPGDGYGQSILSVYRGILNS